MTQIPGFAGVDIPDFISKWSVSSQAIQTATKYAPDLLRQPAQYGMQFGEDLGMQLVGGGIGAIRNTVKQLPQGVQGAQRRLSTSAKVLSTNVPHVDVVSSADGSH